MKGGEEGRYKEGVEGRKWGLLIEWIREYVESGSQDLTCDIGEVGISVNFLTAENLSTDRLANGYLLAKSALSIGWQPAELAG